MFYNVVSQHLLHKLTYNAVNN